MLVYAANSPGGRQIVWVLLFDLLIIGVWLAFTHQSKAISRKDSQPWSYSQRRWSSRAGFFHSEF